MVVNGRSTAHTSVVASRMSTTSTGIRPSGAGIRLGSSGSVPVPITEISPPSSDGSTPGIVEPSSSIVIVAEDTNTPALTGWQIRIARSRTRREVDLRRGSRTTADDEVRCVDADRGRGRSPIELVGRES